MNSYAVWKVEADRPIRDGGVSVTLYFVTDSPKDLPQFDGVDVSFVYAAIFIQHVDDPRNFYVPDDSSDGKLYDDTSVARVLRC